MFGFLITLFLTSTYFTYPGDEFEQPPLPVSTNNQTLRNRNQELFDHYALQHVLVKSNTAVSCAAENMQLLRGEVLPENYKYDMTVMLNREPQYYSLCLGDNAQQHTVEFTLEEGHCDILVSVSFVCYPTHP